MQDPDPSQVGQDLDVVARDLLGSEAMGEGAPAHQRRQQDMPIVREREQQPRHERLVVDDLVDQLGRAGPESDAAGEEVLGDLLCGAGDAVAQQVRDRGGDVCQRCGGRHGRDPTDRNVRYRNDIVASWTS